MVSSVHIRRRHGVIVIAALATALACDSPSPSVPTSESLLVYAVLARDSLLPGDSVVAALVATAGTPTQATYRSVERFTMTRARDGAPFAWRIKVPDRDTIEVGPRSTNVVIAGNVVLERTSTTLGLGRDALEYGETYHFDILSQGVPVGGRVTIPARPQPVMMIRAGREVVAWPRAFGAAGYVIRVETDRAPNFALSDTEYVLLRDRTSSELPARPVFTVVSLDSNLIHFLTDPDNRAAGVQGAFGLFGATSAQSIPLSPTPP